MQEKETYHNYKKYGKIIHGRKIGSIILLSLLPEIPSKICIRYNKSLLARGFYQKTRITIIDEDSDVEDLDNI